jgi:hypothetical protein
MNTERNAFKGKNLQGKNLLTNKMVEVVNFDYLDESRIRRKRQKKYSYKLK